MAQSGTYHPAHWSSRWVGSYVGRPQVPPSNGPEAARPVLDGQREALRASNRLRSTASATACPRVLAPSLLRMDATWNFAVWLVTTSACAISWLDSPSASNRSTSRSRSLSRLRGGRRHTSRRGDGCEDRQRLVDDLVQGQRSPLPGGPIERLLAGAPCARQQHPERGAKPDG